jgi:hypothetical protein
MQGTYKWEASVGKGHHDVKRLSSFLIAATPLLLLASTAGCVIPIPFAVYPAEEVGSRLEVTFVDDQDRPIEADGLLIVHRVKHSDGSGQTTVLDVQQGESALPEKWCMTSHWVMGNPFAYFLLPMVVGGPPENLHLIPLIPGYDYPPEALDHRTLGPEGEVEPPGNISVLKSSDGRYQIHHSAAKAALYWEKGILPYLGTKEHPPDKAYWPGMILSDANYQRVRSVIDRQIAIQQDAMRERGHTFTWPPPRKRPTSRVGDYIIE